MELKVKDFAAQQGVTDSIVYRHIRNHREDLGNDVFKRGRSTWLTDKGQEFIKDLMIKQPYVLSDTGINLKLYELQEENISLLKQLSEERLKVQELMKLTQQYSLLEEKAKLLEAASSKKDEKIEQLHANNTAQTVKIAEISLEIENKDKMLRDVENRLKMTSDELYQLSADLDAEKNRKLSFKERITGRKQG